jgi:hypothetical protein
MEKFVVLKNEPFNVGKVQKQRVVLKHSNNTPMKPKDVKQIVKSLRQKYINTKNKEPKILVRGYDALGAFCLKSYEQDIDDMFEDLEDYLRGRVKDDTRFREFTQIEISMFS